MLISKEKTPVLTFDQRPCHHRLMDERETVSPIAEPYRSAQEHLFDFLRQLDLLIWREVESHRRRQNSGNDWMRFTAITDDEVDELLRVGPAAEDVPSDPRAVSAITAKLVELEQVISKRTEATAASEVQLPMLTLTRIFGLSRLERLALLICLAPEIDRRYMRLFGYLHDDMTQRRPSIGLLLALASSGLVERLGGRAIFSPQAPLRRYRMIYLPEAEATATPFLCRPVGIDEWISHYLITGDDTTDPRLHGLQSAAGGDNCGIQPGGMSAEAQARLLTLAERQLSAAEATERLAFYFYGQAGSGRHTLVRNLCNRLKIPILPFDAARMALSPISFEELIDLIFRQARLRGAAVLIENLSEALTHERARPRLKALFSTLNDTGVLTFLCGEMPWSWRVDTDNVAILPVEIKRPSCSDHMCVWDHALADAREIDYLDRTTLASKYPVSATDALAAVSVARALAKARDDGSGMWLEDIENACRENRNPVLGDVARKVVSCHRWEDIVLPVDQKLQLRECCNQVRYRALVYGKWGFEQKLTLGKGLTALFSGPSGTGKTMAAGVIANELRLDLFKIDLSQVVSKYIGETEKNLQRIFNEARTGHAILFFDEADALFGKRSAVRDAHDRYANIETSYLLQKIEEHTGIVILASNLRDNIDEAFVRRVNFTIEFPFPDENHREKIWDIVWPAEVPIAQPLDLGFMAKQFKLTGGHIKNIALCSAFSAAAEGTGVAMRHLILATKREYQKLGWPCTAADFGPYYELLKAKNG